MIPTKLKKGDEIRIIAPANSLALISKDVRKIAVNRLQNEGFKVTFSRKCKESNVFYSSAIKSRVADLHEAFMDKKVKAILTVIGGFNSNQLLEYIDYNSIKRNPKILCGYSDITVLANAITTKTGLVTYSGLHFSTFGMKKGFDYSLDYFKKCLMDDKPFIIEPSKTWSDDQWYLNQNKRHFTKNKGYICINKGTANGNIIGGNLCSFNLLQGTEYMPDLKNKILFIEEDVLAGGCFAEEFDRNLQSLLQQPNSNNIKGIVIGRFQKNTNLNLNKLKKIIKTKEKLQEIPVIANVDIGHTYPMATFPIGGTANILVSDRKNIIEINGH